MPKKGRRSQSVKLSWERRAKTRSSQAPLLPSADISARHERAVEATDRLTNDLQMNNYDTNDKQMITNNILHSEKKIAAEVSIAVTVQHDLDINNLTTSDLDAVLSVGNELYTCTVAALKARGCFLNSFLTVDELPEIVSSSTKQHVLIRSMSMCGFFTSFHGDALFLNLCDRLECLTSEVSCALLIMQTTCIAVFRDHQGKYGYFDPHSRGRDGLPAPSGTAVMMLFVHLNDLRNKLTELYTRLECSCNSQYELVPVQFEPIDVPTNDIEMVPCTSLQSVLADVDDDGVSKAVSETSYLEMSDSTTPAGEQRHCDELIDGEVVSWTTGKELQRLSKIPKSSRRKFLRRMKAQVNLNAKSEQRRIKQELKRRNKNLRNKERYSQNLETRQRKRCYVTKRYQQDVHFRTKQKSYYTQRCRTDHIFKKKNHSRFLLRYKTDDCFRMGRCTYRTQRYRDGPEFNARQRSYVTQRYSDDPEFNARQRSYVTQRYSDDPEFNARQRSYVTQRYRDDPEFNARQRTYLTLRYRDDTEFNARQRSYVAQRYRDDPEFNARQRTYIIERYRDDPEYKTRQRMYITQRYRDDFRFNSRQRFYFKHGYSSNPEFRAKHQEIMRSVMRTKSDLLGNKTMTRASTILQNYKLINRLCRERNECALMKAVDLFKDQIKNGPTFVCTVCHRALFPNQVQSCRRLLYKQNRDVVARCLTGQLVHICNDECHTSCRVPAERKLEWICHTCHTHLKDGKMPAIAVANNLTLADIPTELRGLNILERHLISKCIAFAKIVPLPKGQQRAIRGNVVCVPSEVQETVNALPRLRSKSQMLRVKLKRRLCYKGHQFFQTVTWSKLMSALIKLKQIHPQYRSITIRDDPDLCDPTLTDDKSGSDEAEISDIEYNEEALEEIYKFESEAHEQ
ncbi:uncharacterized protein ACBT44_012609 isoform 1-T1 [Syngnathus typhle]